jgi:predicted  nucleic acid-binding Zn-ribbon protein
MSTGGTEPVVRDPTIHQSSQAHFIYTYLSLSVLQEKQIYDLKRKYQEMEKFKFVLNYKITELKNQTEPKDMEIRSKTEQIQEVRLQFYINRL